ncbi:uncharacterized protein LOC134804432 [Cydia splendana]|uniref:uncharacterized protein LOC134804432 n=1 Tax=Cydia splendana TaxID=1100963 RepID=UPI00213BF81D
MWRAVLYSSAIIFILVSHLDTAPVYPYSARGPRYTVSNGNEMAKPYVEVRNGTYHGSGPREEARAMCSVKTLEVNATANATITRRLHGVVTSRELHSSIQRLEVIIYGQMQQLWQSLDALRAQLGAREPLPDRRSVVFRFKPEG